MGLKGGSQAASLGLVFPHNDEEDEDESTFTV